MPALSHSPWSAVAVAGLLVALLGLGGGCASKADGKRTGDEAEAEGEKKKEEAVPVEVVSLGTGRIEALLRFSTNLEAERHVRVLAESSGRVVELFAEEGSELRRGDVLLQLQDEEQRSALARAQAEHDKCAREVERQEALHGKGLVRDQSWNETSYEARRLALALDDARRAFEKTRVRAPIDGTVSRRLVGLGAHVAPSEHLFDLTDLDSIVARVHAPEKDLHALRPGMQARIRASALGASVHEGRVERLSPLVDPTSGTVKVSIAVPRAERLLPGMFVDVELVLAIHDEALLLPKRALVYIDDSPQVFRVGEDGRAERVQVIAELSDGDFIEPASGFASGDRIVIAGQAGLKDGALVELVGESPAAPGEPAEGQAAEEEAEEEGAEEAAVQEGAGALPVAS